MPYCSYISPEAQKIGSVNTVIRTQDGLHGFNTDYFGFKSMAARAGIDFAGKKVVVLGSGGTSLTARAVAADCGADRITVVSRSGEYNYENLEKLSDCEGLINTTPVGMYPNNGCSAVKLDSFPRCEAVLDVIYNPLRTELIMQALERGISCSGGLYMLVAQAAQSAKYFCSAEIGEKKSSAFSVRSRSMCRILFSSVCQAAARLPWRRHSKGSRVESRSTRIHSSKKRRE